MKIAIISDVHNNEVNLKKVLDYCARKSASRRIKTIICCGDLASKETLDFLCDNFSGIIHYTFGNMDNEHLRNYELLQNYKNTKVYRNFGEIEINKRKIAFVHYPDAAEKLCQTGKYDFVFYGHTHKPWVASAKATANQGQKKCTVLNPGNVAGEIYPPTFAVWETDTDKFDLIRIHSLS